MRRFSCLRPDAAVDVAKKRRVRTEFISILIYTYIYGRRVPTSSPKTEYTNIPKIQEPPQNFRRQKRDVRQYHSEDPQILDCATEVSDRVPHRTTYRQNNSWMVHEFQQSGCLCAAKRTGRPGPWALLICSFLPCLSWLLRSRVRKSRRDLWITLYKLYRTRTPPFNVASCAFPAKTM
jgi:hypothetical protein